MYVCIYTYAIDIHRALILTTYMDHSKQQEALGMVILSLINSEAAARTL